MTPKALEELREFLEGRQSWVELLLPYVPLVFAVRNCFGGRGGMAFSSECEVRNEALDTELEAEGGPPEDGK